MLLPSELETFMISAYHKCLARDMFHFLTAHMNADISLSYVDKKSTSLLLLGYRKLSISSPG